MRPQALAALLLAAVLTLTARALPKEPWLKAGDVVALVGGENMVALAEEGWLETLVTWAQPGDRIRFRSLAWEGDTVFEQRRDLNYPALETQLDRMGATVVICQFGKMESFAGKEGVAAFTEAYEKLLARLSGEKKRRIALVLPTPFWPPLTGIAPLVLPDLTPRNAYLSACLEAIRAVAGKCGARVLRRESLPTLSPSQFPTRDGVHPIPGAEFPSGVILAIDLEALSANEDPGHQDPGYIKPVPVEKRALRTAIAAKNRLWFHYTRPQNWAFLAGNRTNQPSSRDHLDPTRRWFPEEMEQWLPLIEAKEKEIQALAAAPR